MELTNNALYLFGVVWQNSFFHWVALILLGVAIWGESRSVRQYQRYVRSKSQATQSAIAYLSGTDRPLVTGSVELEQNGVHGDKWRSILDWFGDFLVGETHPSGEAYTAQIRRGKFLLLQYPGFLSRSIPRSQWRFVPSLVVAIGVLGTFYGIQEGLQNINLGSLDNTAELLPSIQQLLAGMKTAFSTSLMGLGCSSIFTLVLAWGETARAAERDTFASKLDKIAQLQTPEQLLARLQPNSSPLSDSAAAITLAAQTMQTGFGEILAAQNRVNSQDIGDRIGMAMMPIFQEIRQDLMLLRQIKADQGEALLNTLVEGLRSQVIEPVVARLNESSQMTQEASEAVKELKNELGGISQSLAQSILTIQDFQQETLGRLQQFAGSLQGTLGQFQTDTKDVLEQMAAEIRSGVAESIEGMKAQRSAFQESAEEAARTFLGIQENLQAALQTQAQQEQQMLQGLTQRMTQILKSSHRAFQTQSDTIKSVGDEASQLMNHARQNLVSSLENVDSMLQNTRQTVEQELEKFRIGYQASLQDFFQRQNNLLESTLGKQQQGLAKVVIALQQVFQEESRKRKQMSQQVDESMEKVLHTAAEVSYFATSVGLNSSDRLAQLQELAKLTTEQVLQIETVYQGITRDLKQESDRLAKHYETLTHQLNQSLQSGQEQVRTVETSYENMVQQFDRALQLGNYQLIEYLETVSSHQTKFFEEADTSMAEICQGLQESSNGLMQVAHYLVAAADNLGTKKAGVRST